MFLLNFVIDRPANETYPLLDTNTELFIPSFAYTRFRAYVRTTPALNRVYANEGMNNSVLMCKLVTQTPEILRFLRDPGLLMRAKICPHVMYSRCHDAWG